MQRIAEREVVLLDREDVREVAGELDLQRERERAAGVVVNDERVLHPGGDVTPARDRQLVAPEAAGEWVAHEERAAVGLRLSAGKIERPLAVDG